MAEATVRNHPVYDKARAARDEGGSTYIETKDVAALIRSALQAAFPGVAFSVRSSVYSGGSSIDVSWADGPTGEAVESVAKQYAMGGFDGMIDMGYSVDLWLSPDGSVSVAYSSGTACSRGMVPESLGDPPHPRAIIIRGGADFVFCRREIADEKARAEQVGRLLCERQRIAYEGMNTRHLFGQGDGDYLQWHVQRLLNKTDFRAGSQIVGIEDDDNRDNRMPYKVVLSGPVGPLPKADKPQGPFWSKRNLLAVDDSGWAREFRKLEKAQAEVEKLTAQGFRVEIARGMRNGSMFIRRLDSTPTVAAAAEEPAAASDFTDWL